MKLNEYGVESYLDYCGEVDDFATEADLKYKAMRFLQTNRIALRNQLMQQKKLCSQKFNSCNTEEELNHFASWIEKQKASIQRKINGNEIKDKAGLQKFISLYQEYESKINTKRNTLNQNKEE